MSGTTIDTSRRTALKLTGGSVAALTASNVAAGDPDSLVEVNVGYDTPDGRKAALDAASDVVREFGFDALTVRVPRQAVDALDNRPDVRYVEANGTWRALAETYTHNQKCICVPEAHACGYCGEGADVAIIDTGIDSDHPDLQANLGSGQAFVSCNGANGNVCHYPWDDDNDHGTHVAGIAGAARNGEGIIGTAPCATLHAVKVLDSRGRGSYSDVAAGIEYVADQGWDVANMSLGGSTDSQAVKDACEYAYHEYCVLLVAAAGNSGPCTDCVAYPAAYDEVIAVASVDCAADTLSSFSSTGPEIELAAPGTDVYSTVPGGYDTFSGTSMAAPHVSGVGALLMGSGASCQEARNRMCQTADDIGLGSNEQGCGRVNAAHAVGCSCEY